MPGHGGGISAVRVNDISSVMLESKSKLLPPETLVHQEAGLGHRGKIRAVGSRFGGRAFSVNYAVVRRSLLTRDVQPPSPPSPGLSAGAIGGIAACALVSILLLVLGVFIWHRRDRRQGKPLPFGEALDIETPKCDHTLTGPVVHHTPSLPALPPLRIPSPSDSIMISVSPIESDSEGHPDGTYATSSTESRTRLVSHSNHSDGRFGSTELGTLGHGDSRRVPLSLLCPPVMPSDGDPNVRYSMRPLPQPRIPGFHDNHQNRSSLPDLWSAKMQAESRLPILRPITILKSSLAVSNPESPQRDEDDLPPPDYDQATQYSMSVPMSPLSSRALPSPRC